MISKSFQRFQPITIRKFCFSRGSKEIYLFIDATRLKTCLDTVVKDLYQLRKNRRREKNEDTQGKSLSFLIR